MTLKPLHDRIIVRPGKAEETTKSGIIIPDSAQEKSYTGEVIAVGPGKLDEQGIRQPLTLQAGDTILYGKYSGSEFKLNDEEVLIMRESDVFAVIEKEIPANV